MVKATASEVFTALKGASLPVTLVDALNTRCYFSETVSSSAVLAIVSPLEWDAVEILVLDPTGVDPYPQYLNTTRHDALIRHEVGVVVPHDTTKITGPLASTDNAVVRYDLTTGVLVQDSLVTIDDTGSVNVPSGQSYKINGTALAYSDITGAAPLASPALTGTPTAPTAAADTDTTHLATTAFVLGQASDSNPLMDGTAAPGTSEKYARNDHVHPSDTAKADSSHNHDGTYIQTITSVDNTVTRFDGVTGEVQGSLVTIDDTGSVNIPSGESYKINGTNLSASDVGASASDHDHDGDYCRWRGAGATEPADPVAGDIWIDTSGTPVSKVYDGTNWV